MKTLNTDLFPETLLVDIKDGQPYTTSLKVATHFKKLHKNVLQSFDKIECSEQFSRLNFQPREYVDKRGKPQKVVEMTWGGFAFLAMGFTGKEAAKFKEDFINAFITMQAVVLAKTQVYANALDMVRPNLRPVTEMTKQGFSRSDIAAPLGKSCGSVTYQRGQARRFGLLPTKQKE